MMKLPTLKARYILVLISLILMAAFANAQTQNPDSAQQERENVLSLAVMSMVYKDWQASRNGRGHNIGSILVDKNSTPVFWARNSVTVRDDGTQHGEVRLIQAFLNCPGIGKYIDGYTIYTTLEPCAMCAGMAAMTKLDGVVYVQVDPEYGNVRNALASINFPRLFQQTTPKGLRQKNELEQGWAAFRNIKGNSITEYLITEEARKVYASADQDLNDFKVKYPENEAILLTTREFIKNVGPETFDAKILERCPK